MNPWLNIRYQDRDFLIVDKPAGILSVPGRIHPDSILSRVKEDCENAYAVHRLDMDTSGLLIVALRRKSERSLQEQFRERSVQKKYVAVVDGIVTQKEGVITAPLSRSIGSPPRSYIDELKGKSACTHYQLLEYEGGSSRLLLLPKTGRSHQLRVHLQSIGHPIIGDRFYHPAPKNPRMLLHAQELVFTHPYHGTKCHFIWKAPF